VTTGVLCKCRISERLIKTGIGGFYYAYIYLKIPLRISTQNAIFENAKLPGIVLNVVNRRAEKCVFWGLRNPASGVFNVKKCASAVKFTCVKGGASTE
jgi:hypothetical protein